MARRRHSGIGWSLFLSAALMASGACGEDPTIPDQSASVEPFVGTWDAEAFTVTSDADPPIEADLLDGGSFDIVIEPSGLYTATLVFGPVGPIVEIGTLVVHDDNVLSLQPTGPNPCPGSSLYEFEGPRRVTLDGPTCFDFNLDGEQETAQAHIELRRR